MRAMEDLGTQLCKASKIQVSHLRLIFLTVLLITLAKPFLELQHALILRPCIGLHKMVIWSSSLMNFLCTPSLQPFMFLIISSITLKELLIAKIHLIITVRVIIMKCLLQVMLLIQLTHRIAILGLRINGARIGEKVGTLDLNFIMRLILSGLVDFQWRKVILLGLLQMQEILTDNLINFSYLKNLLKLL